MKDKIMNILIAVVILEVILLTAGSVLAMLGLFGFNTGCVYRYDAGGASTSTDSFKKTISIRADGNPGGSSKVVYVQGVKTVVQDPGSYGQWQNVGMTLDANQKVNITIDGKVSLCTSHLPTDNIGSNSNLGSDNKPILIPRVEDTNAQPITLIFDAKTEGWRNLLELYNGDIVEVILKDAKSASAAGFGGVIRQVSETDVFGRTIQEDCSEGKQKYLPVCGRWSMWNGKQNYVNQCIYHYGEFPQCGRKCCKRWAGSCWDWGSSSGPCYYDCQINTYTSSKLPVAYKEDGSLTIPQGSNITALFSRACLPAGQNCAAISSSCKNSCVADPTCNDQCACSDPCADACTSTKTSCKSSCSGTANQIAACQNDCDVSYTSCSNSCVNSCIGNCANGDNVCSNKCRAGCSANVNNCVTSCENNSVNACKDSCTSAESDCNDANTPNTCPVSDPTSQNCLRAAGVGGVNLFNQPIPQYRYWFSARDAGGLLQRISDNNSTAGPDSSGEWATIKNPSLDIFQDHFTGRKIYSAKYTGNADSSVKYLQYKFPGDSHVNYTGGYVLQVKHTKCQRIKGEVISDSYKDRGQISYIVSYTNPNQDAAIAGTAQPLPKFANGKTSIITKTQGDIWFRINNNPADYKDSIGSYNMELSYNVGYNTFNDKVLTPFIKMIRNRVNVAGMEIFQNLLCLTKDATGHVIHTNISGACSNFFNYIKAILSLYIMTYGLMFVSGIVKASYQDVVIRVVKVGIVAGLLSGQTFVWFNDTIFNFVIGFTDQIIANFGGFNAISSVNNATTASGPFMFIDTIFTKIFFTQTFAVQLMAIMGIGMVGLIYFVIIAAAVIILIIVILRAVAVYIIAMIATAFLISLTPIFLTFMLFEQTYYLFEGWYKALFRFMMEPVILMIGIIVLTQIFTLYIDNVLSYSACWKCALSFYIPFAGLLPLPGLESMPLFCIYWFAPWGLDNSGTMGQLGMDLSAMLGLVIIAFTMYGYADLAGKIASQLTSAGSGAPSAIGSGVAMARSWGQKALSLGGLDDATQGRLKQENAQKRAASRQALGEKEKSIIAQEKKAGTYESDTSKALKKGQEKLSSAASSIKSGASKLANKLGIGTRDHTEDNDALSNNLDAKHESGDARIPNAEHGSGSGSEAVQKLSATTRTEVPADTTNLKATATVPTAAPGAATTPPSSATEALSATNKAEHGTRENLSHATEVDRPTPDVATKIFEKEVDKFGHLSAEQLSAMYAEKDVIREKVGKALTDAYVKEEVYKIKAENSQVVLETAQSAVKNYDEMKHIDKNYDSDGAIKSQADDKLRKAQDAVMVPGDYHEINHKVEVALLQNEHEKSQEALSAIDQKYAAMSVENGKKDPASGFLKNLSEESKQEYAFALHAREDKSMAMINPLDTVTPHERLTADRVPDASATKEARSSVGEPSTTKEKPTTISRDQKGGGNESDA